MDLNRKTAYEVLVDVETNQSYSNLALNNFIEKNQPENPAFVRELVYGVLENRILLDYYLDALIASGIRKVKARELTLLRMGVYQLMFMESVPDYAALNESVKMARKLCRGREGFINGVLRGFQRKASSISLPSKEDDGVRYLSVKYSAVPWIVELWMKAYGMEETEKLLAASNGRPLLSLRVNLRKGSREELLEKLAKEGFQVEAGIHSDRVILVTGKGSGILDHEYFRNGWFSVQDEASVMAADTVGAKPGDWVIDICAAPGGKTLAMAETMEEQGCVYAFDIYPHKLTLIEEQAKRVGISIIKTGCQDGRVPLEEMREKADCVLADVPCSGLGVIRRKPEIKYKEDVDLEELVQRQKEIFETASSYVKPGGTLVYSTCTVNPDENELQVEEFIKKHKDFTLVSMNQLMPGEETDGFFISKMIRSL